MIAAAYAQTLAVAWLLFALLGVPTLYVGFGFVMAAKRAKDQGLSQRRVVMVDSVIALAFALLDVMLNVVVLSAVLLDFRPRYTATTITSRLSRYASDAQERAFRRYAADVMAAFLDGKDPRGDHIIGPNQHFKWLD